MSTPNLCRGCMNHINVVPIASLLEPAFKDIFEKCTGLQIFEEDLLPKIMCNECNMKCNQWKQFKQQCENSLTLLTEMFDKKDIEFMDVGVVKEEESDDEKDFDTTGFDDTHHSHHSSESDEKEKLADIVAELNPELNPVSVCEIKEECLELRRLNPPPKIYIKKDKNPNLILPPMKMIVKKSTDLSSLDQDEFSVPKTPQDSSAAPPTRNLEKRNSTKRSYADDEDHNNSGKDDSGDDMSYRKRPTLIYKCKPCRKKFSGVNLYEVHYITAHMPGRELIICGICGKKFGREKLFEHHLRRNHVPSIIEAKFHCEICERGFIKNIHLQRHMLSHRTYKCEQCGKSFPQKTKLSTHILTHVTERLFTCTICDKSYKTLVSLRHHKDIHEKAKSFCCTECGKLFLKLSTLKKHMYSHTQERPFKCAECPKDYKSSNMLTHHMKVHSTDPAILITCEFCSRTFRDRKVYDHHRMTHTGERPYSCTFCNRGFIQRTAWKTHMKTHVAM